MVGRQIASAGARMPRSAIVVIACLLLGLAIGALVSSFAVARKAAHVDDATYILMVADLYDHEKSVFNARERLAVLGKDPVDVAEAAVETYSREHPEARRDVDSLRQLAQGLRQADADANANRSAASPGLVGVLGLIVASVLLAAGAAWAWKFLETRGLRLPRVPAVPAVDSARRGPLGRGGFASALATVVGTGARVEPRVEAEEGLRPTPVRARGRRPGLGLASIEPPPPLTIGHRATQSRAPARPVDTPERRVFETAYTLGEDPYDEIHPIVDDRGELIGACGLSATEPSDRPGRFYGFTAWLQDYTPTHELSAVGLVSRSGQIARSAAIAEWRRRGTIDDVHPVERGLQVGLRSSRIDALLTIVDFDYTPPAHGSPGYFGRLIVQLNVGPNV